ncbi:MAG: methyltransferase domain-containing protein [Synergistaceae bacterium]|nr:methyltransferase domain-containing protein [Synergistaceae bacterium]
MNQIWNADNYSSSFSFVHKYGEDVLNLIVGENVRKVLDLGCGTGALTNALAERGYEVTGLDASENMLKKARESFPSLSFRQADASDFRIDSPADAVFSNAVLHWIDRTRQPLMMKCVYDSLRLGGQFVFEMGGSGCGKMIHEGLAETFKKHGREYVMPFFFPTIGEYADLLEDVGFTVRYALLFDRPTKLKGADGLHDWISMFVSTPFLGIGEDEKECIIHETTEELRDQLCAGGQWYADYVRLRMRAVKE